MRRFLLALLLAAVAVPAWSQTATVAYREMIDTSAELAALVGDETGSGAMCFATSPTLVTPLLSGKINADAGTVSDDDCTGETGLFWFDDTDNAFEFCGPVSAPSLVAGPSAALAIDFDDSDDAGAVDVSINANCPTANDCDLEFAVNSGADSETVVFKIDTTDAGATSVQMGAPGTNYVQVDEAGALSFEGTGGIVDGEIEAADISTIVQSYVYGAGFLNADGTQCADPAEVTVGSWGKMYAVICADNDGSTVTLSHPMPDDWNAGTVVFRLHVIQDAVDTSALQGDVAGRCVGDTETPAAYGTEVAVDDTMTGTDALNYVTSGAVTLAGTCAAGDFVQLQYQVDATGTTTGMTTLNIVGAAIEWTSNVGS